MQWLLYVYTRWKCAQFRELRQYTETAKFDPTSMMNGGGLRYHRNAKQAHVALCSPQLWREDDQYHISTEARWSLRVPDEQPCTMTTLSSQCATNIYTSHVRKDKNTSDGSNTNICSDTITEGECCIIVGAETANCVPGLFINDQYNLSAFKIHDYKNIYLFERHVTKNS